MELAPPSDIYLGVWIRGLPGPSDDVFHVLHDGDNFLRLYIKVILQ